MLFAASAAYGQIEIRVSVKFILDAAGKLPTRSGGYGAQGTPLTSHQAVVDQFTRANQILANTGRGYHYRMTEILDISGVSQWFETAARDAGNRNDLESAAIGDPGRYKWRTDSLNVYINNSGSGVCSFPGDHSLIFLGANAYDSLFCHEAGHFFNLKHTHEGESGCADNCGCGDTKNPGNSDSCADTLPDHECWGRDQISQGSFGPLNYNQLDDGRKYQVDNVFLNVMSYHLPQDRFTSDQLDRFTDAANSARNYAVTGHTRFVDRNNGCLLPDGSSSCGFLFGGPYHGVRDGVNNANGNDVVLIRPGQYKEPGAYTRACTLRATRGWVTLGTP